MRKKGDETALRHRNARRVSALERPRREAAGVRDALWPERPGDARESLNPDTGGTTNDEPQTIPWRSGLVFAGPTLALLATVFCLVTGAGARLLGGGSGSTL